MTMQHSYKSIVLPLAEYVRLQQLMLTLIGSRTVLASILRRKLGAAAPVASAIRPDLALSGRRVEFRIDGGQYSVATLSWLPQKRGNATSLSLLSPRGLALLGLGPGESIAYTTDSGKTEFLEVIQVAEVKIRVPAGSARPKTAQQVDDTLDLSRPTAPAAETEGATNA